MRTPLALALLLSALCGTLALVLERRGGRAETSVSKAVSPGTGDATGPRPERRGLQVNVAMRVSAPEPARTIAPMLSRLVAASKAPALRRAVIRTSMALSRAGVGARRDLLASFSFLVISLERTCPPPALLVCRPAIRISGRLHREPAADLRRDLRVALIAGLRASGFRPTTVHAAPAGALAGRVTSRGETLARWRLTDGVVEVATGGLRLSDGTTEPATEMAPGVDSVLGDGPAGAVEVQIDHRTLAALL